MTLAWLLRARRWIRHPPGPRRVLLVVAILALCLALAGIERLGLWPDALTVERRATPGAALHPAP